MTKSQAAADVRQRLAAIHNKNTADVSFKQNWEDAAQQTEALAASGDYEVTVYARATVDLTTQWGEYPYDLQLIVTYTDGVKDASTYVLDAKHGPTQRMILDSNRNGHTPAV